MLLALCKPNIGLKSDIEAAVHATRQIFVKDVTEAILLIDAEKAFNNFNRKTALHNITQPCPSFHQYLVNTYRKTAKFIFEHDKGHDFILSGERCTQGEVAAIAKSALGIKPLINDLSEAVDNTK